MDGDAELAFGALGALYDGAADIVRRAGRTYPAAISPTTPRAALEERPIAVDARLRQAGERYVHALRDAGRRLTDDVVARFSELRHDVLRLAASTYFTTLATSEALRVEYVDAVAANPGVPRLPLRAIAHESAGGDPLHSGAGRASHVGVSVVVTFPAAGGRAFAMGRRRDDLAADGGLWDIVPSATVEPTGADPAVTTAVRELREELGIWLRQNAGGLLPLGLGHDLLRLSPEVCFRLDLEHHPRLAAPLPAASEYAALELVSLAHLDDFWSGRGPHLLTPSAAAAIALLERSLGG